MEKFFNQKFSKSCQAKVSFSTKIEAEGAAVVARYRHGAKKLKVYKCPHCRTWHLSSDYDDEEFVTDVTAE